MIESVKVTRLIVHGAGCECCGKEAVVSVQVNDRTSVRYYCIKHLKARLERFYQALGSPGARAGARVG